MIPCLPISIACRYTSSSFATDRSQAHFSSTSCRALRANGRLMGFAHLRNLFCGLLRHRFSARDCCLRACKKRAKSRTSFPASSGRWDINAAIRSAIGTHSFVLARQTTMN